MSKKEFPIGERPTIRWESPEHEARAHNLAQKTGLEPAVSRVPTNGLELMVGTSGLELRAIGPNAPRKGLKVDFLEPGLLRRAVRAGNRTETLVRAVGARHGQRPRILDTTAGLGRDAFILAAAGCEVTMTERNPVLAAMLEAALEEARLDRRTSRVAERLKLAAIDARKMETDADVIYLDPMFPARDKSAAVKKEMQLLQRLLGPTEDGVALLEWALENAGERVVVKRPRHAQPLGGRAPDMSYEGSSTRFDAYMIGARSARDPTA